MCVLKKTPRKPFLSGEGGGGGGYVVATTTYSAVAVVAPRSHQPQSSIPNPHPLSYLLTLVHALTHQMYYRWSSKVALEYILGPQQSFRRQCEKYEKEVRNGGQGSKYWQNQVGRIVHSAFVIATRNATISSDLCATGSFHHTVVELGMSSVS